MPTSKTRSTHSAAKAKKGETNSEIKSIKKTPVKKASKPKTTKATKAKKSLAKKQTGSTAIAKTSSAKLRTTFLSDISKGSHLVIVESPAKAKTIKGFLGGHVDVQASFWHVADLPNKTLGVDIKDNFKPTYEIAPEKKKVISELKRRAVGMDGIWLATDEDREWEAIAWHVANALGLDVKEVPRIVFHEITKEAIKSAVSTPRKLDIDLVDAQQARRVLDRIVWFSVSPILWTKIKRGLSAGRVQSVAVKLVVEREREIQNFKPEESRKVFSELTHEDYSLSVELTKIKGKTPHLKTFPDIEKLLAEYKISLSQKDIGFDKKNWNQLVNLNYTHPFTLSNITVKSWKKNPSPPFITSTLQQEASRRFGWTVKQVMSVAQRLYEAWYITYMRTDSTNLSSLALGSAKEYITSTFGEKYHQVRQFTSKIKNAQEAHEAIRPSYIDRTPEKSNLAGQELSLYRLIWLRTVASQMASAEYEETTYDFAPEGIDHTRSIKGEIITFPWFLTLYGEKPAPKKPAKSLDDENNTQDEDEEIIQEITLPKIKKWTICSASSLLAKQLFSQPPSRYTESGLVKALESRAIWRPSTYAPTIATIQDRWYVEKKEDKKIYPLEISFHVQDYLEKYFTKLMNYEFTAKMEDKLDDVAIGKVKRESMMQQFYDWFETQLLEAKKWEKTTMPVGRHCPKCKDWNLIFKFTKFGKFIGCDAYPECDYTEKTQEENDALAPLKEKYEGKPCPEWGTIVVKIGRFGPFLTSSLYPEVKRISSIPDDIKIDLEAKHWGGVCPDCKEGTLVVKKARRGNYFLACSRYPDCKHAENIPWQENSSWAWSSGAKKRFRKKAITKKK